MQPFSVTFRFSGLSSGSGLSVWSYSGHYPLVGNAQTENMNTARIVDFLCTFLETFVSWILLHLHLLSTERMSTLPWPLDAVLAQVKVGTLGSPLRCGGERV